MFVYYYRIFDRYERPIMGVAILGDDQADWRPARFDQEMWGCVIEMHYPIVKLLDWRAHEGQLAASANPFAVIVQAHLAEQDTRAAVEARRQIKIRLIRGLYERGYNRTQVLELFRLIDWLLALPKEREDAVWRSIQAFEEERKMPYITSIERIAIDEGKAKGLAEGRAEGLTQGLVNGQRAALLRIAQARFGSVPEALERRIASADQTLLDQLTDQIATVSSLDDLDTDRV